MTNTDLLSSEVAAAAGSGAEENALSTPSNGTTPRRRAGLSGMVLAELRELAGQMGITGTAGLRKGDLIAAIKEKQGSGAPAKAEKPAARVAEKGTKVAAKAEAPAEKPAKR